MKVQFDKTTCKQYTFLFHLGFITFVIYIICPLSFVMYVNFAIIMRSAITARTHVHTRVRVGKRLNNVAIMQVRVSHLNR